MKKLVVVLILANACQLSAGEREWDEGLGQYREMLNVCNPSKKKLRFLYETRDCWANFLPQRCKSLVWIEDFAVPIQMCLASCVGKNTAFGDCSK